MKENMCCNDKYLENLNAVNGLYDFLNVTFFESALSKPVITIQRARKENVLGTFTNDVWVSGDERFSEINLSADYLDREPIDKAATVLHEMVHDYARHNGIKDHSRGGAYHNKQFKMLAEKYGMTVEQSEKGGWNVTRLTEDTKAKVLPALAEMPALRRSEISGKGKSKSSSTRKYVCFGCGTSVRATKDVNIMCADCDVIMSLEE